MTDAQEVGALVHWQGAQSPDLLQQRALAL